MKTRWRRFRCRMGWHYWWWYPSYYERHCGRCPAKQFDLSPIGGGWEYFDV